MQKNTTNNCCEKCIYKRRGYDGIPDADLPCIGSKCECHGTKKNTTLESLKESVSAAQKELARRRSISGFTYAEWDEWLLNFAQEVYRAAIEDAKGAIREIMQDEKEFPKDFWNEWEQGGYQMLEKALENLTKLV